MHIIIFSHSLLSLFFNVINNIHLLRCKIQQFLKKTRNITKGFTVIDLKLYCELQNIRRRTGPLLTSSSVDYPLNQPLNSSLLTQCL